MNEKGWTIMNDNNENVTTNKDKKADFFANALAIFFVIILLLIAFIFIRSCSEVSKNDTTPIKSGTVTNVYKYYATGLAKRNVEEKLNYPASSSFQSESEMTVTYNSATQKYSVKGYVDAANAFGAKERKYFTVTMKISEKGEKVYSSDVTVTFR